MKIIQQILAGLMLIAFVSCESKDETSVVEHKKTFSINIPIITADIKSANVSAEKDYLFSGAGTFSPESIDDSENDYFKFQKIKPQNGSLLSIPGVNTSDEFYNLKLEWGYKTINDENFIVEEQIDLLLLDNVLKNNVLELNMDIALAELNNKIANDYAGLIQIKITGNSNFDMNCIAKLEIPVIIETQQFTPRFELF